MSDQPQVWVGCLGCYNGDRLVGDWFPAVEADEVTIDLLHLQIHRVERLADEIHEELWVFDFENFHGLLTEECSPMHAKKLAEVLSELEGVAEEHGFDVDVAVGVLSNLGVTDPEVMVDTLNEEADFHVGAGTLDDLVSDHYEARFPELSNHPLWPYVAWDRVARDWQLNGTYEVRDAAGVEHWFLAHGNHGETSIHP